MIEIRPLTNFTAEDFQRVNGSYTCTEKYQITYHDSDECTSFKMQLVPLAEPFTGQYDHIDAAEIERYTAMLPEGFSFGAYDGQVLVGLLIAEKQAWNNSLMVWEFHVAADYRRQGIGRSLMETAVEQARLAGIRILTCGTQNLNANAIKAYRALGFRPEAIDISLYSNTDYPDRGIAVYMKRRI